MFKKLVSDKKNIVAYIITALVSFGVLPFGGAPFGIACIGALIENKIPILIPFVLAGIITGSIVGITWIIRFAVAVILYALFKSYVKPGSSKTKNTVKFFLAQIIAAIFVILLGKENISQVPVLLFEILISTSFVFIFDFGIKTIFNNFGKETISPSKLISTALIFVIMTTVFLKNSFYGMSIFSIASIVILMMACWKKNVLTAIIYSMCISFIFIAFTSNGLEYVLLYCIVGIIAALLSKAGRKGLLIGAVFALIYCMFFLPTRDQIYKKLDINREVLEDYQKFLNNKMEIDVKEAAKDFYKVTLSGDDETEKESYLDLIDNEVDSILYAPSSTVLRELFIGFVILLIIPNSFYRAFERITKGEIVNYEEIGSKLFQYREVYLLNPAKDEGVKKQENDKEKKPKKNNLKKKKKAGV